VQEGLELQEDAVDELCPAKVAELEEINLILPEPVEEPEDGTFAPLPRYWEFRVC
jgi:hypothetical protein